MPPFSIFYRSIVADIEALVADADNNDGIHSAKDADPWVIILISLTGGPIAGILLCILYAILYVFIIEPVYKLVRYKIPPAWKMTKETLRYTIPAAVGGKMRARENRCAGADVELVSAGVRQEEQEGVLRPLQAHIKQGEDDALPAYEAVASRRFGIEVPRRYSRLPRPMRTSAEPEDSVWYG